MTKLIKTTILASLFSTSLFAQQQAGGPSGTYNYKTKHNYPHSWSARLDKNIKWRTKLPEGGQSGIAVYGNKLFLTTMKKVEHDSKDVPRHKLKGADITAYCVNASNGKILWSKEMTGDQNAKSEYMYGFSDSSTPTPIATKTHVYFYNASGKLSCFKHDGTLVWERDWKPVIRIPRLPVFPFNKQFEPFMHKDTVFNMEPRWTEGDKEYGHNRLVALDAKTGELKWFSQATLTHYNTPQFGKVNGKAAALIGRGSHHRVPEGPRGYSLIDLETGKEIWKYSPKGGMANYNSTWNSKYTVWMHENGKIDVLDSKTGEFVKTISLTAKVDLHETNNGEKSSQKDIKLGHDIFPAWYSNIIVGKYLFFTTWTSSKYRRRIGELRAYARVNLETDKVEYLEVPVEVNRVKGQKDEFIWDKEMRTETVNSRGLDTAHDKRSQRDGWHWNFNPNPIVVNNKLYLTSMVGITYCIDIKAKDWSKALMSINDLGEQGKVWTVNTITPYKGHFFHRTLKELICIRKEK